MTWSLEVVIYHFYDCTTAAPITAICQCPEYTTFLLPPHTSCERVESDFNLTITNGFPGTKHSSMFSCGFFHHFLCQSLRKKITGVLLWSAVNECPLSAQYYWMKTSECGQMKIYSLWILFIDYLPTGNTHSHTNIADLMTCSDLSGCPLLADWIEATLNF